MSISTPYYLIDEKKLLKNMEKIKYVRENSGAKTLLALKCFSTWSVFPLMKKYMDGTTSSSPYEARMGREKFGKEVHAYSVAYSDNDINEVRRFSDKVIFNSISQLKKFYGRISPLPAGLRVNPGISYSHFDLADPARKRSRLGETGIKSIMKAADLISGVMFHFNCENRDFKNLSRSLDIISRKYAGLLKRIQWVSLGGGIYFTENGYPIKKFCGKLKEFGKRFNVQVYLEPGETAITQSAELVTKVLDIVHNKIDIAVVDASSEAHMLDLLIYRTAAGINNTGNGRFKYIIAGRSCLAGDVFGKYRFAKPLRTGSIVKFSDAAGYSMVKKNWFNGLQMPSIVVKRLNGTLDVVRRFNYNDFSKNLS